MTGVGENGADEADCYQCSQPVFTVHAAMIVVGVMGGRRRCRMMLLHYNGAAVNRSAPMHCWLAMVVRSTSAHGRTIVDRTTFMVHGLAFMHAGTLMAGVAFMY